MKKTFALSLFLVFGLALSTPSFASMQDEQTTTQTTEKKDCKKDEKKACCKKEVKKACCDKSAKKECSKKAE